MSMTLKEIDSAAELLCSAHAKHVQLLPADLPDQLAPASFAEAYAIQDAVAQKRWLQQGGRTHTWKTGAPSNDAVPYAAPIPPDLIHSSPAVLPASGFHIIGIESELAYRFSRDLPSRDRAYSVAEIMDAIEGVYVAIEVVDTRLKEWQQAGKLWQLADNQITGGLVVGSGRSDWRSVEPLQQSVELWVDGVSKVVAQGSHPLKDPRPLVYWIANHCTGRNGGLRAGDLVTTGTWSGLLFVEPGATVIARFPGIGEAEVSFPN